MAKKGALNAQKKPIAGGQRTTKDPRREGQVFTGALDLVTSTPMKPTRQAGDIVGGMPLDFGVGSLDGKVPGENQGGKGSGRRSMY